jgi:hypothetical protein
MDRPIITSKTKASFACAEKQAETLFPLIFHERKIPFRLEKKTS